MRQNSDGNVVRLRLEIDQKTAEKILHCMNVCHKKDVRAIARLMVEKGLNSTQAIDNFYK